jgi:hypothetical protein
MCCAARDVCCGTVPAAASAAGGHQGGGGAAGAAERLTRILHLEGQLADMQVCPVWCWWLRGEEDGHADPLACSWLMCGGVWLCVCTCRIMCAQGRGNVCSRGDDVCSPSVDMVATAVSMSLLTLVCLPPLCPTAMCAALLLNCPAVRQASVSVRGSC